MTKLTHPIITDDTGKQIVEELKKLVNNSGVDSDELYAPIEHDHDDKYQPLGSYASANHNHDGSYSPSNHTHEGTYAPASHDHNGTYAPSDHNHDGTYAPSSHTHDAGSVTYNQETTYAAGTAGAALTQIAQKVGDENSGLVKAVADLQTDVNGVETELSNING